MFRVTLIILLFSFLLSPFALADDVYQRPEDFVKAAYDSAPPEAKFLKVNKNLKSEIDKIMDRNFSLPNVKYWDKNGRSVWILEEIGKVKPITAGFVIENDTIENMKVLIYRESHGWEVKHDFFTDQFKGASLKENLKLTQYIDNISGATMSVDTLRNLGELALFLHKHRNE